MLERQNILLHRAFIHPPEHPSFSCFSMRSNAYKFSVGGGMKLSTNRTLWPVQGGGAISIQPGWFQGHATAFFYINMGFGGGSAWDNGPPNMSFPMVPVFQITGPRKGPYPG